MCDFCSKTVMVNTESFDVTFSESYHYSVENLNIELYDYCILIHIFILNFNFDDLEMTKMLP